VKPGVANPPERSLNEASGSSSKHKTLMARFYEQLAAALAENQPFTLALISGVKGSSPQRVGAKALFFEDGHIVGTLGGGCLEAEVHARARRALQTGTPATFELLLDHDFGWDDGLICGGSVSGLILPRATEAAELWRQLAVVTEPVRWGVKKDFSIAPVNNDSSGWLYEETVSPRQVFWIAGSGHVAQAVAPLALQLDFDVTVFDDRPGLANHRFFPEAVHLRVGGWHELLQEPMPKSQAFGLIVTRGHQHDALVLTEWIHRPFVFLGMIGSRRKARIIREQFVRQNMAGAAELDRLACPVGVDIHAQSTPEIAVSVMAQFIQKRAELNGR
jgi:xanthine dehydrogenase accessory factor